MYFFGNVQPTIVELNQRQDITQQSCVFVRREIFSSWVRNEQKNAPPLGYILADCYSVWSGAVLKSDKV